MVWRAVCDVVARPMTGQAVHVTSVAETLERLVTVRALSVRRIKCAIISEPTVPSTMRYAATGRVHLSERYSNISYPLPSAVLKSGPFIFQKCFSATVGLRRRVDIDFTDIETNTTYQRMYRRLN